MLDENNFLILDKNKNDITKNVINIKGNMIDVKYNKIYHYNKNNLIIKYNPSILTNCRVSTAMKQLKNINKILKFDEYIKIFFNNGTSMVYNSCELIIEENLLSDEPFKRLFNYLKEMAGILNIGDIINSEDNDINGLYSLKNIYEKVEFINNDSVIKSYVNGISEQDKDLPDTEKVYPFSFNLSQQVAIENAFSNKVSIIEGPPGTGKTQTILNIIANAIIKNKSVAVLSNNNSATDNVYEKLEKYDLQTLCAKLGKRDNVKKFIDNQKELKKYPNSWNLGKKSIETLKKQLLSIQNDILKYLEEKNEIALLKHELDDLVLEEKHYKETKINKSLGYEDFIDLPSDKLHDYLMYLNKQKNKKTKFSIRVQIFSKIKFGKINLKIYKNDINEILEYIELQYYKIRISELKNIIKLKEDGIKSKNYINLFNDYTNKSMDIFKNFVYVNYNNKKNYDEKSVRVTHELIKDYPIILSTTYSLLNCISPNFMFDYMIIDESSQVDIVSSFPVLFYAKNIIIVGDSKQLPNIIDKEKQKQYSDIFKKYDIEEKYDYTKNSLLELTKKVNNVAQPVILKEHYRCHPKIIDFCNKNFYDNELIILSESNNSQPIKQFKCVKGNHARKNNRSQFNDRQAQVILNEIIPQQGINIYKDSVGIITPYKEQKNYLKKLFDCENLRIDTIHGFQGREANTIIFSTVANDITKFLDNPNSINVAVSRAINNFYIVTPYEYKSSKNSNIANLISYINYNNFEVVQSKTNSVFDLLYSSNNKERKQFLENKICFSKYYSETIMYNTIKEVLKDDKYKTYDVLNNHYPLRKLVKNSDMLNPEEMNFINRNSHVDFLIFNKFDKNPILAIEVDGYRYHSTKRQNDRDNMKNQILKKCQIPLIRFKTNECNEYKKLQLKLDEIIEEKTKTL